MRPVARVRSSFSPDVPHPSSSPGDRGTGLTYLASLICDGSLTMISGCPS